MFLCVRINTIILLFSALLYFLELPIKLTSPLLKSEHVKNDDQWKR
jgi:hypothetical protein